MKLSRRDFMKANAVAAAAAVAGVSAPTLAANLITSTDKTAITWDKAPCRFCGTGCSVLVGSQDGRVVATQGDPDAPVNRGLNCIKGYFLSKIMYGEDRLTQPMLRMTNGKFDKNGDINADLRCNSFRPYLGLGFGRVVPKNRLGFRWEIGCQYMGKLKIYQNGSEVDVRKALNDSMGEDGGDIADIVDKLKFYPVLKLQIVGRIL